MKLKELSNTLKKVFLTSFLLLVIDQTTKIWVKTNMLLGPEGEIYIFDWFRIHYIENNGMAYGIELGGDYGKLFLTLFRIIVVGWGVFYVHKIINEKRFPTGLLICFGLIIGGALGNIIDSTFYGVIFNESSIFHGKVVDMLYFPLTGESYFLPEWMPYFGGDHFIFFRPIFNIADSAIFVGIISILLFYRNKFE